MSVHFDETDCLIVQALFENARITNADLAKRIALSESQCARRLHKIERAGIITGYTARIAPEALDLHANSFVAIKLDHTKTSREVAEQAIKRRPEVVSAYRTGGDSDFYLRLLLPDLPAYQASLDELNAIDGVAVARSLLVLDSIKQLTKIAFPYPHLISPTYVLPEEIDAGRNGAAEGRPKPPHHDQTVVRPSLPALRGDLSRSKLDQIDLEIIRHLADNSRISLVDLGAQVGLSAAPCGRRVHALERSGVITAYTAKVNFAAVGLNTMVFIQISFNVTQKDDRQRFEQALIESPEVLEAHRTHGKSNYLVAVIVQDLEACDRFLTNVVLSTPGVISVQSSPVLKLFHSRR